MASQSAVDWVRLAKDALAVGDVVSADAGGMPIYRVVAITDGQVWLQDDQHPKVHVLPMASLRWKAARPPG